MMSRARSASSSSDSSNSHSQLPADGSTEKSVAGTVPGDEEKHLGLTGVDATRTRTFEPIRGEDGDNAARNSRPQSRSRSLHTVQSHRSYAAGDGYTCWDEEEPAAPCEAFEITWASQPESKASQTVRNPRLMSIARRWLIVIIVSSSSLCV